MEKGKSHEAWLRAVKLFTVLVTALIFPVNAARAIAWYELELGLWEIPGLLLIFAAAWHVSYLIIDRASKEMVYGQSPLSVKKA